MTALATLSETMLAAMELEGIERVAIPRCTCGVESHRVVAEVDRHGIPVESRMCLHCGTVRLSWQPAGGWLYSSGWYRRLHTQRGDEATRHEWGRRQWDQFAALAGIEPRQGGEEYTHTRTGDLVDIGGDVGGFAGGASTAGWAATSVEVGDTIPRCADVYTMMHVLEHMPDCIAALDLPATSYSTLWVAVPDLMQTHVGEDAQAGIHSMGLTTPVVGDLGQWWTIAHPWNWTARGIVFPLAHAGWAVRRVIEVAPGELATVGSLLVEAVRGPTAETVQWYIERNSRRTA